MIPPRPPLPTPSNFPFQPVVGIHTSTLMSDAGLGLSVTVTRQKDGRPWIGVPPLGGVNVPDTVAAEVMVVSGNAFNPALLTRSEHVSAAAGVAARASVTNATAKSTTNELRLILISSLEALTLLLVRPCQSIAKVVAQAGGIVINPEGVLLGIDAIVLAYVLVWLSIRPLAPNTRGDSV